MDHHESGWKDPVQFFGCCLSSLSVPAVFSFVEGEAAYE